MVPSLLQPIFFGPAKPPIDLVIWAYSCTVFRLLYTENALVAIYSWILKEFHVLKEHFKKFIQYCTRYLHSGSMLMRTVRWMQCMVYLSLQPSGHEMWACLGNTATPFLVWPISDHINGVTLYSTLIHPSIILINYLIFVFLKNQWNDHSFMYFV